MAVALETLSSLVMSPSVTPFCRKATEEILDRTESLTEKVPDGFCSQAATPGGNRSPASGLLFNTAHCLAYIGFFPNEVRTMWGFEAILS